MARLIASLAPLLFVLLHLAVPPAMAVLRVWVHECNSTDGNYTIQSSYKTNLDTLFTKITTTSVPYGFYNFSTGTNPDLVSSISLCIGNLEVNECHTCQSFVIGQLKGLCPNQKTAIAFSDDCMIRYSDQSIFGKLEKKPSFPMPRGLKADNVEQYSKVVNQLLASLPSKASSGDSQLKFSTGEANINETLKIYAAAQCTPDLSKEDCLNCLNDAINQIHTCCTGERGARVLLPSCTVRYEEGKFYLSSDAAPAPAVAPSTSDDPGNGNTVTGNSTSDSARKESSKRSLVAFVAAVGASLSVVL